jgi:4-hydroxymandelate oxidase
MGRTEDRWFSSLTRRRALSGLAGFLGASPLLQAQQDPHPLKDHRRTPGLNEMVTVFDFEPLFYANVPLSVFDFTAHGGDGEFTVRRNREAFGWVELVPRVALDAKSVDTSTEIFKLKMAYPIMVAPTGIEGPLHPEGEKGMHKGATGANTTQILSVNSSFPIEEIAAAAKGPWWFQWYPQADLDVTRDAIERAQAGGCQAVVVTVDQQSSYYERDLHDRNLGGAPLGNFGAAGRGRRRAPGNPYRVSDARLWYEWKYFDQIRPFIKVPMLAKGIVTAEDAKVCLEHGMDGIYVSNHGGRGLDYEPSTLEVLPEIVDAVQGRVPVIFDGGCRRGTDILKALALGAKAVCFGRPTRWGLAAFGAAGVQRVLEILQQELVLAMANTGYPTVSSVDRTAVRTHFS